MHTYIHTYEKQIVTYEGNNYDSVNLPATHDEFIDQAGEDDCIQEDDETGDRGEDHGPVNEPCPGQPVVGHVLLHPIAREAEEAHDTRNGLDDLHLLSKIKQLHTSTLSNYTDVQNSHNTFLNKKNKP